MTTRITYRGHTARMTSTTTDVRRSAFGRTYQTVAPVWEITGGPFAKPAGQRPFLTSINAVREYIRERS